MVGMKLFCVIREADRLAIEKRRLQLERRVGDELPPAYLGPPIYGELEVTDRGVRWFSDRDDDFVPWRKLVSAKVDDDFLVLRMKNKKHFILTCDGIIEGDVDAFVEFLTNRAAEANPRFELDLPRNA